MGKKIVIVDDDHSIKSIFEFILMQVGYEVLTKETGAEAEAIVKEEKDLSLMFLDSSLPDTESEALCEKLLKENPKLPIVIMANIQQAEILNDIFRIGAYGIIYKPFDVEEVLGIIPSILGE